MNMRCAVVAATMLLGAGIAIGADVESGVPVGEKIGTYSATKCAGVDDGVDVGESLCYT